MTRMLEKTRCHAGTAWTFTFVCVICIAVVGGCGGLRLAPSETIKQNAWLHERTAAAAAETAVTEQASAQLQSLTKLSELQSQALTAYCGVPDEVPSAQTSAELLDPASWQLAETARIEAARRPDPWDVTDTLLEIGIGVAALAGGVYGTRIAGFLRTARTQSQALREIVTGNERFKRDNARQVAPFKTAQAAQSPETRQLVAGLKG